MMTNGYSGLVVDLRVRAKPEILDLIGRPQPFAEKPETDANGAASVSTLFPDAETLAGIRERLEERVLTGFFIVTIDPETMMLFDLEDGRASLCLIATRSWSMGIQLVVEDVFELDDGEVVIPEAADAETFLRRYFFKEINKHLDDQFLDDDTDKNPITVREGSLDAFVSLCQDLITVAGRPRHANACVTILTATDDREAQIYEEGSEIVFEPWAKDLLEEIVERYQPYGFRYEYNDGDSERVSGYSREPDAVSVTWKPISALERAEAVVRLKAWCREALAPDHLVFEEAAVLFAPGAIG